MICSSSHKLNETNKCDAVYEAVTKAVKEGKALTEEILKSKVL